MVGYDGFIWLQYDGFIWLLTARVSSDEGLEWLAMTASFGSSRTASSGPTCRSGDALIWAHRGPSSQHYRGRRSPHLKVVPSSIRCGRSTLTCGSSPAIGQQ